MSLTSKVSSDYISGRSMTRVHISAFHTHTNTHLLAAEAGEVVDGTPDSPVDQDPGLELLIQTRDVFMHIPALLSAQKKKTHWLWMQMRYFCSPWITADSYRTMNYRHNYESMRQMRQCFVLSNSCCNTWCAYRWFLHEHQRWFSLEHKKFFSLCLWSAS